MPELNSVRSTTTARTIIATAVATVLAFANAHAQHGAPGGEWPAYSGDRGSTKYSALDQINAGNVAKLVVAWRWESPDNPIAAANTGKAPGSFKVTPLMAGGVLYTTTTYGQACAINPETGETLWVFDPGVWKGPRPGNLGFNARGLAYWTDGNGDERIFLGTNEAYVYALNATSGELVESFWDGGRIDLMEGLNHPIDRRNLFSIAPGAICGDTLVMGMGVNDRPTIKEMTPGDVRGYDVRTGKVKWAFHNPPWKGEPGYETWMDDSADYTGNSNVWSHMSVDTELGYVYLPFGTPTNDFYGGHRKGAGLYGESLVCVNGETGEKVWHFQHVHHGLWDWDLPTAPVLCDIVVDGKKIKALAQPTKQGFLWVLDRTNGQPVWPIEERPVPQTTVEGEETWPTQPFPTRPAPYTPMGATPDLLIDFTPELHAKALAILEEFNYGPPYTPPLAGEDAKMTIVHPGWGGGGNWMGAAFDPESMLIFVPSLNNAASTYKLVKPDPARSNFDYIGQLGRGPEGPDGLPLFKPPYLHVTAIDLKTGEHAWEIPIGDGPRDNPAIKDLQLPPLGDFGRAYPLATKSLLFIASSGADRPNFRAIDKKTGEIVHEMTLPGSPSGTPMTYSAAGKQFIVAAVGGGRDPAELIALSVP
jgi:quinoprotein glucose dehydrogenase